MILERKKEPDLLAGLRPLLPAFFMWILQPLDGYRITVFVSSVRSRATVAGRSSTLRTLPQLPGGHAGVDPAHRASLGTGPVVHVWHYCCTSSVHLTQAPERVRPMWTRSLGIHAHNGR